jgi:hypothetical protein
MIADSTKSSLLNFLFYQVGWFACVLGAANGWERAGTTAALVLVLTHLSLAERPGAEWPLMLTALGYGLVVETLQAGSGILDFRDHQPGSIAPLWILALWLQFATIVHFCLRWLSQRYFLACALGLAGGPLAFLGGERLGAATLGEPRMFSLAVLGFSWAIALPTLVWIGDRLGGVGRYWIFGRSPHGLTPQAPDGV